MAEQVPLITLNNGRKAPMLGLGTSQFYLKPGEKTPSGNAQGIQEAVEYAISIGYRHIDTALAYQNEVEIGQAIRNKIGDGTVKREDLFITTKLWSTYNNPSRVRQGLDRSLQNLQLDYVDLFLVHTPASYAFLDENTWNPTDENGKMIFDVVDHADIWKEMEKLVDAGLAHSIGISNFNQRQIQYLLDHARIPPANLQIEGHAYLMQNKLFDFCKQNGITVTAYAPIGSPARWTKQSDSQDPILMEEPDVVEIAKRHGKTPSQVLIRFLIDSGRMAAPRSTNPGHIRANIEIWDFKFSPDELALLKQLDKKGTIRFFPFEQIRHSPDFPFGEKEE